MNRKTDPESELLAALEPLFVPFIEQMRLLNKNFEKFAESLRAIPYIRVEGDLVMGEKVGQPTYRVGDIGAGARVAIGENISWREGLTALPDGATLELQFDAVLEKIARDPLLDEDARELARQKVGAIADGMANVAASPRGLRRALMDARSWFAGTASGIGAALIGVLKGEAAQKTLGTVTEAATKAAIEAFTERV